MGSGISPPLVSSRGKQKHWRHLSRALASDMPHSTIIFTVPFLGGRLAEMGTLGMSTEV